MYVVAPCLPSSVFVLSLAWLEVGPGGDAGFRAVGPRDLCCLTTMGAHFVPKGLDDMQAWKAAGVLFVKIHGRFEKARGRRGQARPDLIAARLRLHILAMGVFKSDNGVSNCMRSHRVCRRLCLFWALRGSGSALAATHVFKPLVLANCVA